MNSLRPTWAEIDLDAIAHNIRQLRGFLDKRTRFMAVIKANAYGHGMVETARVCEEEGVDFLGVALLDEACQLRERGIKIPILILGYTPNEALEVVVENGFRQTVYDVASARELSREALRLGRPGYVHLKIDTGMSRIGFLPEEKSLSDIEMICRLPGLEVEGVFTHFAAADSPERAYTQWQMERFTGFLSDIRAAGLKIPLVHAANSAGIIEYPEAHFDMVRAGIGIYGLCPSPDVNLKGAELIPAMRLVSRVVSVKQVPPLTAVSYGGTFVTQQPTRIATVPVGYGDGFTRFYSNRVWASIRGCRVPLIGRVCMDNCMFDVTGVEGVEIGDEVTLFGRPEQGVTADELAEIIGTINYEVVCLINSRVPRVYKHNAGRSEGRLPG